MELCRIEKMDCAENTNSYCFVATIYSVRNSFKTCLFVAYIRTTWFF